VGPIWVGTKVGQGDRGERDAGRSIAHSGDVDTAAAALACFHDPAVLHLDPGLEPVDEPEAVVCFELVQVAKDLRWWRVVVGDAKSERQAVEALHRSLGIHDSEVVEGSIRITSPLLLTGPATLHACPAYRPC
jgi:hypothetical protein